LSRADEKMVMISFRVPPRLKEAADASPGGASRWFRQAAEEFFLRTPERAREQANALWTRADEMRKDATRLVSLASQEELRHQENLRKADAELRKALLLFRPAAWANASELPAVRVVMDEYALSAADVRAVVKALEAGR